LCHLDPCNDRAWATRWHKNIEEADSAANVSLHLVAAEVSFNAGFFDVCH
jgi:hypothetical protein